MNFCNMNPMNVRLNIMSGNLLPLTGDDEPFHVGWRIHSVIVLLVMIIHICAMIPGVIFVPRDKAMKDSTVGFVIYVEVFLLFTRMYWRRNLINQLIRKLNNILRVADEIMSTVVRSTMNKLVIPLKFYYTMGLSSILLWYYFSFLSSLRKRQFFYVDYRIPVVLSKEPFSCNVFVLGNVLGFVACVYVFTKNVALNVYMMNIVLLITAQYRYITTKLVNIFRRGTPKDQHNKDRKNDDLRLEMEMKALCRHYNALVLMMPMLNQILALNFSLIYTTNIFRLSFIGIMLVLSPTPLEMLLPAMYLFGAIVQLYILCLCVHQLLDANVETTHKAFHEKWYQYGRSVKSSFLLMILGNNLELKLSTFGKYNLSLPTFMTILNKAYSIALLFARVR